MTPNSGAQASPPIPKPLLFGAQPRMILGVETRRNNRLFPLGGSSVHACLLACFPSSSRKTQLPISRPFTTLFPQVASGASGEGVARGMAGTWVVRGSPLVHLSRPLSQSCTELLQAPLSGWSPPRAILIPLSSTQFSLICYFPTATFTPAGPCMLQRLSSPLIGR